MTDINKLIDFVKKDRYCISECNCVPPEECDDEECEGQTNIYDYLPKAMYQIEKPIRLIELFGGIGSQAKALERLGADFEHYRLVEYDKYPVKSYNAIHGTNHETADITKIHGEDLGIVDTDTYEYIMCYSFPCQDLSVAGKMAGMTKGSGTRSGLLWEVERLLDEVDELPQILLMENVPQVHSKKNMGDFQRWIDYLTSKGYSSYWQDLNAKDFGVAQSRNRCFMVSILGDFYYEFPKGWELDKVMKDYLEDEVDEKYYLTSQKAKDLIDKLIEDGKILTNERTNESESTYAVNTQRQSRSVVVSKQDTMQALPTSSMTTQGCVNQLGWIEKGTGKHQSNLVYGVDGISPCMNAVNYKEPYKVVEINKDGDE